MARTDKYTVEFKNFYAALKKEQREYKKLIDKKYTKFLRKWIATYSPYKVGDVLEVVGKTRMKYKRMVIYLLDVRIFSDTPMLSAYGWWLDKDNNPVHWNGSGYPLLNCMTDYKMVLSENQVNNPRSPNN